MRQILIIFGVILVLLILLTTFGGSIKINEPFFDKKPARKVDNEKHKHEQHNHKIKENYYEKNMTENQLPSISPVDHPTENPAPIIENEPAPTTKVVTSEVPIMTQPLISPNDTLIEPFESSDNQYASV